MAGQPPSPPKQPLAGPSGRTACPPHVLQAIYGSSGVSGGAPAPDGAKTAAYEHSLTRYAGGVGGVG